MFHHVKELQFNARVTQPDPQFAGMLLEQFGGGNGELKAAMQYFTQAFGCRRAYPDKYDLLMDIATEEFSHLEIVGATITMLLDGINGDLKDAAERADVTKLMGSARKQHMETMIHPQFLCLTGGGPAVTNSQGVPWTGAYINANGDLTVDLRSNIGAESRAKIVYEYLMQFTDDALVKESLAFLMTREVAHFQMFSAALETIQPNFPPGVLQGDPRYTHTFYNMSNGPSAKGPWNDGQGPWAKGEQWKYIEDPVERAIESRGELDSETDGSGMSMAQAEKMNEKMSKMRSKEVTAKSPKGKKMQWCTYPQESIEAP